MHACAAFNDAAAVKKIDPGMRDKLLKMSDAALKKHQEVRESSGSYESGSDCSTSMSKFGLMNVFTSNEPGCSSSECSISSPFCGQSEKLKSLFDSTESKPQKRKIKIKLEKKPDSKKMRLKQLKSLPTVKCDGCRKYFKKNCIVVNERYTWP